MNSLGNGQRDAAHVQSGSILLIVLIVMMVTMLLGLSAVHLTLQSEKAARADRDSQIALHAAESALSDAEADIEASPDTQKSRSHLFSRHGVSGFSSEVCAASNDGSYAGICRPSSETQAPVWSKVDFLDQSDAAVSIAYGRFTGRTLPVNGGSLPARLPRYIIEPIADMEQGGNAGKPLFVYRITAVGFGPRDVTQVALQSVYRKAE